MYRTSGDPKASFASPSAAPLRWRGKQRLVVNNTLRAPAARRAALRRRRHAHAGARHVHEAVDAERDEGEQEEEDDDDDGDDVVLLCHLGGCVFGSREPMGRGVVVVVARSWCFVSWESDSEEVGKLGFCLV